MDKKKEKDYVEICGGDKFVTIEDSKQTKKS